MINFMMISCALSKDLTESHLTEQSSSTQGNCAIALISCSSVMKKISNKSLIRLSNSNVSKDSWSNALLQLSIFNLKET